MSFKGKKSIQVVQQEIRSLVENFDWETNPNWYLHLKKIEFKINDYWTNYLKREYKP